MGDLSVFHVLWAGMDRYYGLNKPAKVLCVGYSHTVLGIDAERMETELDVPVAKYATAGANTLDRKWMVRHFLDRQPSVSTVIYDVDPRLFDTASYTLFLPYIDDPAMAEYLRQEATWQEYLTARLIHTARFRDQTINIALRGLLGKIENKKMTRIRIDDYRGRFRCCTQGGLVRGCIKRGCPRWFYVCFLKVLQVLLKRFSPPQAGCRRSVQRGIRDRNLLRIFRMIA